MTGLQTAFPAASSRPCSAGARPSVRASLRIGRGALAAFSRLVAAVSAAGVLAIAAVAFAAPSSANEPEPRFSMLVQAKMAGEISFLRSEVLRVARNQLGDDYRAGHAGPDAFDCGGLAQFVFERALGMDIGRSSRMQFQNVERIPYKHAQPGDLVFFLENGAHHVGIYIGDGRMIDAPNPGEKVSVNPISGSWWGRHFTGIGRVLPAAV